MSQLTFFTAPKPFADARIAQIQVNAIRSWLELSDVSVLLMGDEKGLDQHTKGLPVRYVRDVVRNELGTPLLSSMFELARQHSESELLCVVNTDMILMDDFLQAALRARELMSDFVLLARRWDLALDRAVEFHPGWQEELRGEVRRSGKLHRPTGSDLFLFPRACYQKTPAFAVGRAGWDNWMIFEARRLGWPVIDATESTMLVHQNHDYSHLPGGAPHYRMPESQENMRIAGGAAAIRYTVLDATHWLRDGELVRPTFLWGRLARGIELILRRIFFFLPSHMIEDIARPRRWKRKLTRLLGLNRPAR